jgi:SAM-dependent methyltransferase
MRSAAGLIFTLLKQGADPNQILVKLALRNALADCASVLDVGCGPASTLRQLGASKCVGIDGYLPAVEEARQKNTHDEILHGDIRELPQHFKAGQFDACIAMDVIEHLPKQDGLKLMRDMEVIAKKKVVFFTPNGFLPQKHATVSDLQEHLSGWEVKEMQCHGYMVEGQLGPKKWRGEYHALKKRPAIFWGLASLAAQMLCSHNQPGTAAAILCTKTIWSPQGKIV